MPISPMMAHYLELKKENPDKILFYRLGDFYEMFYEDAVVAARELSIALTGKQCGLEERAPMCGVPFHAADGYILKLVEKGYKVAICEQLEGADSKKGIMKRGVVRVMTPGTVNEISMLKEDINNYILSIYKKNNIIGAAYADVSTGAFFVEHIAIEGFRELLSRVQAKEIIFPEQDKLDELGDAVSSPCPSYMFGFNTARDTLTEQFGVTNLSPFNVEDMKEGVCAAGALIRYLKDTQMNSLSHICTLKRVTTDRYMTIDNFTRRNLELTQSLMGDKKASLLGVLDITKTSPGARMLREYIDKPLKNKNLIEKRLSAVETLKDDIHLRSKLRDSLDGVYDIERILSKVVYGSFDGRSALALLSSIRNLPQIKKLLKSSENTMLKRFGDDLDSAKELTGLLQAAISDSPPLGIRDGGIIRDGFNAEVDKLRDALTSGEQWLKELEEREKNRTGIKSLKVRNNRVFGYYIEVPRASIANVPYYYVRKQTVSTGERFITEELKDLETNIMGAGDKLCKLECELFLHVRSKVEENMENLQKNAHIIAHLDVLLALAQVAYDNNYVKPSLNTLGVIDITDGRHPVVEKLLRNDFVPNNAYLDETENKLLIITGPNMGGKSTFMRQAGLIVIMAHIGSFVPAVAADICMTDRVFTRVGASDDLSSGRSTFMLEMNELASILNSATKDSLLILDEIGRGTSTQDGLSIAWATVEYILDEIKAKTLFATHYHELTALETKLEGVKNYSVTVKEEEDSIIFLRRIKRGGADRSFGIEVARLAGLPKALLARSEVCLKALQTYSNVDIGEISAVPPCEISSEILKVIDEIKVLKVEELTPIEAMVALNKFQKMINLAN